MQNITTGHILYSTKQKMSNVYGVCNYSPIFSMSFENILLTFLQDLPASMHLPNRLFLKQLDDQWRPSSQCHRAMALVVFLPRPEIWGIFWVPGNKKSQSPEVALVDFRPDGRSCQYIQYNIFMQISTLGRIISLRIHTISEMTHGNFVHLYQQLHYLYIHLYICTMYINILCITVQLKQLKYYYH